MKIKNFNIPDFGRIFTSDNLEDTQMSLDLYQQSYDLSKENMSSEDMEVADVILTYLEENGCLPYDVSPQEKSFLQNNKLEKWCEYLVFRYKLRKYPTQKKVSNFPVYLLIEPVSACNLRCVMCFQVDKTFTKKPYMGTMSLDLYKNVIDQAIAGGTRAITLASRGEPLMHKQICEMLSYAKDKFFEIKINTNATKMTEEHCHAILSSNVTELVFSIDAERKDLYEKIRVRGNFDTVIDNIKMFNSIKKKHYPSSNIMTTASGVFFHEEQSIEKFTKFFKKLVDNVAVVNIENRWNTYTNEVHPDITTPCEYLWQRMYVWFDGISNPCDVDYKSNLQVGNLSDSTIKEIWSGKTYSQLRKDHISGDRSKWNPCDRCGLS
jgi:sulfatase maturation enzyme AslB (radical SAM superfamily)